MRKSVVILLVIAAVVVLLSPGIIGRIAEESVDSNLRWAADENEGIAVTAVRFDRGWFSSEGRHRIDVRDPGMREALAVLAGREPDAGDPAVIIDTRIDHGLIPVTSVGRADGSLAPGLGRGVSTLFIEYPDGQAIPVPGTIYSTIGLDGTLSADYVVAAGSLEADGGTATWGDTNIDFSTDHTAESFTVNGTIESLVVSDAGDTLRLGKTVRSAIDQGFSRALMTILDCNITTLVAAFFLFSYGTGPVKGFAVTLAIGLVTSMFTAIMLTRWLVILWLRSRRPIGCRVESRHERNPGRRRRGR